MKALVLAGGGAKGAWQCGVLSQLQNESYDFVVGTSAGSLNAAGLAHLGFDGLKRLWFGIKSRSDVMSWNFSRKGIFDLDPLAKIVHKVTAKPAKIQATCCAVRLEDGAVTYSQSGDRDFPHMVIASCSIPGAIIPYEHDDSTYIDGGTRENCPVQHAYDIGATDIDVILCNPLELDHWIVPSGDIFPVVHYTARAFEIMSHEQIVNDLVHRPGVNMRVFAPNHEPCGVFDFDIESIQTAYELGASHDINKHVFVSTGR